MTFPHHERITDPEFRHAVDLLDEGKTEELRSHLQQHPGLIAKRVSFEGSYFKTPTLLAFIAENPIRRGTQPGNIVEIARVILDAGGKQDAASLNETLMLVSSGRIPRETGHQLPLIHLLCHYGADPNSAMSAAIAHGEFKAVESLIGQGAKADLVTAAALNHQEEADRLLGTAGSEARHCALAVAAQFGRTEIVRLLLDAGENADRFNPSGFHAHSTPLHQAALAAHEDVVQLLMERGASPWRRDSVWQGTPADWAQHAGHHRLEAYLRSQPQSL